jgi:hypothetical protein
MALLDFIVDGYFRSEKGGRVVIFPRRCGHRSYVVKSAAEELRIRSFLRMFYFAHFSILLLGSFLAYESSMELCYALGKPAGHLLRTGSIVLGTYSFVVGLPYWLLWRSYRKDFVSFVSAPDEVAVSGTSSCRQPWIVGAGLIALAILTVLGAMFLVRNTSVAR